MMNGSYKLFDGKVIIRSRDRICDTPEELLSSRLFREILKRCVGELSRRRSRLLEIFDHQPVTDEDLRLLIETIHFLIKIPSDLIPRVVPGSDQFFRDRTLFKDFIEFLYNYWRQLQRLIICDSAGDRYDKHPYRTFNNTVETLTHVVRSTYRDVQESITGNHPRIYRQVSAGAEIAAIALPRDINYPDEIYRRLNSIPIIRQVLIYPPLIFNPPMNKRSGVFGRVFQNPLDNASLNKDDWLCYPAWVGPLLVMIYFNDRFFELGFSLSNLFELADDAGIERKPDAILLFGVPDYCIPTGAVVNPTASRTVFYEDSDNNLLVGAIPDRNEFGYFGYVKKMVLTLHNIKMMEMGRLPFHGALVNLVVRDKGDFTILVMGDTGAGKSETLEALRQIGEDIIQDITIISDDMGSLEIGSAGCVVGYGTETGAFVRLDDLQLGYAFGQIDRTILMNPDQTNARVVLPVTTYETIVKGFKIDCVLYANNYEEVDEAHPIIQKIDSLDSALEVFREGAVMSKGTTTNTGLVRTYFANVFGPQQHQDLHEGLARHYFDAFYHQGVFVGQMRTRLGIPGQEHTGPEAAARELLKMLQGKKVIH
jgi:hypothetical protein